ncbi:spike base protein, RCAP_Rcc01079 family [Agrobacterium salinitolerans]
MAAIDPYARDISQVGPARNAIAVTPSDSADLANVPRAVCVSADGNVVLVMSGNGQEVTVAMVAGTLYPLAPTRIKSTGTTATGIVAVW